MKSAVWLAATVLGLCACGPEQGPHEAVTPAPVELSSGLPSVPLSVACTDGTCPDSQVQAPWRGQLSPSTLGYSTYLGFGQDERGMAVAVDASGCAYVTGRLSAVDGSQSIFVAKLGPAGQLLYYTYFPGLEGRAIAVDSTGHAYLVGAGLDGYDIVAKLNPSGTAFDYYARIGVSLWDLALDPQGNVHVAGIYSIAGKGAEVWVGKLNAAGSAFLHAVTFGGSGEDRGSGIAIDGAGNAYVTGLTASSNFPLWNAFQGALPGFLSGFVAKLNAEGTALLFSTYLGGAGGSSTHTRGHDIAVDGAGNAYVVGETNSTQFPVTPGAAQPASGGIRSGFVAKLSATGARLYATYLGGGMAHGVAVDGASGVAYVTGLSGSGFPVTSDAFQAQGYGAFVTLVSPSGSAFSYSSILGGSLSEFMSPHSIALDPGRNVYVVGGTNSTDFPTTVSPHTGGVDAFVTKFNGP